MLSEVIGSLQNELVALSSSVISLNSSFDKNDKSVKFCFKTKEGNRKYSPAVRELYSLVADQLSPARISSVLKCFLPSLDVKNLQLPSETCASYMRGQELTTVHKAAVILESGRSFDLNTELPSPKDNFKVLLLLDKYYQLMKCLMEVQTVLFVTYLEN